MSKCGVDEGHGWEVTATDYHFDQEIQSWRHELPAVSRRRYASPGICWNTIRPFAEVRIAIQPNWPLEYSVGDVVCSDSIKPEPVDEQPTEQRPDADPQGFLPDEDKAVVVYITEGTQIGYAPAGVFGR